MKPDIWFDGRFVRWEDACIHPLSHSMQRGATLFESIDCREAANGRAAIFRLDDHLIRFENSAHIVGMPLPYSLSALHEAITDTVARSGMKNCTIRPLAFYADPVMQVHPGNARVSVVVGLAPSAEPHPVISVQIATLRKIDESCMPVKAKVSGNYIGPMIAKVEAGKAGFDDTVILDRDGFVAEGATANVFIVEDDRLVTAPDDSILPGITRDTIRVIAESAGIKVVHEKFTPERLKKADEAIMCSSGAHVTAIVRVNDASIGSGAPGPVTLRLRDLYRDVITGRNPAFAPWLTFV